ncbi:MAG: diguanylate cyclase [Rhodospirillales bacterium]|nr:diguanylate cyclase [Rhodospirillales bacterium]
MQSVLVIDDDPIVLDIVKTIFNGEIQIEGVSGGKEGIEVACATMPDLILLDVRMPDIDGYETIKRLKDMPETADIPVVFLTARTETQDEFTGLDLGAIDYISKPIIPQIVKVRINNHLTQKMQRDQLSNMSMIDGLTGIANRRRFDDFLDQEIRRAARNDYTVSLLMLDIDNFKNYNDTHGHQAGDDCLKMVAAEIQNHSRRPSDLVARFGGEEFAVILPDTALEPAMDLAEKIRSGISALGIQHASGEAANHVTISIGVAALDGKSVIDVTTLIAAADKALFGAKNAGRNRVLKAGD